MPISEMTPGRAEACPGKAPGMWVAFPGVPLVRGSGTGIMAGHPEGSRGPAAERGWFSGKGIDRVVGSQKFRKNVWTTLAGGLLVLALVAAVLSGQVWAQERTVAILTPYLASVTTNQMIKALEAQGSQRGWNMV